MVPWGCLGGARGLPGAALGTVRARFQTQPKIDEQFERILGGSWDVPGAPWGPTGIQKSPENRLFVKKKRSRRDFFSIFVQVAVFNAFCGILHGVFTKNQRKIDQKNYAFFHSIACLFEHGDPHETSYFTMRKLLFHFLCFCFFLKKTSNKSSQNAKSIFGLQNHHRTIPGHPFRVPK